jgi:class 3 adenylate cyclase
VAVVYTDLVGSTETVARLGPDAGEAWRKGHLALLREALAAGGGREIQAFGDGILAVCESASDAAACAVAMQQRVTRANARRDAPAAYSVRVGVSVGEGTEDAEGIHGLVVVEAARLCAAAKGGQILASALVEALCAGRGGHRFAPIGSLELKGLPAPVPSLEVHWESLPSSAVPLPPALAEPARSAFVGRVDERRSLAEAARRAAAGERRVVLVAGEPGIGKTRLAAELAREGFESGALVLYGRCDEELGAPYQPFAEALAHYARAHADDALREQLVACGTEVSRIVPEIARRLPGLAVPLVDEPEAERFRLFEAVDALFASASRAAPVVVVLDDLHWADKPSLLLLRHLARSARPAAVLLLGSYRETDLARTHPLAEVLADLRREPCVERVRLAGLDAGEVGALLAARARHAAPEAFVRLLHAETEGNPFFVDEVLRHLVESGALRRDEGRWTSDRSLAELGIPEGIREVVGRRLSRLSEGANEALHVAAVVGREFDAATVAAAQGAPLDPVLDALDEACRARIAAEVKGEPGRFAFTHALIRQTLYQEIGTTRRVRLHWRVAEALEARLAGRVEEHLPVLAHHAAEGVLAGDPLRAARWSIQAGLRASRLLAHEDAMTHHRRALSLLEQADTHAPELRYEALVGLGEAAVVLADLGAIRAAFGDAIALAKTEGWPDRHAAAAVGHTSLLDVADTVGTLRDEPLTVVDEALAALGPGDSPDRSQLLARRANLRWLRDLSRESQADAEEALAIARRTGGAKELAAALSAKGFFLLGSPALEERLGLSRELLAAAEAAGNLRTLALAHRSLVGVELLRGDRVAFDAVRERGNRLARESGARGAQSQVFSWDAAVALAEGRFDDAKRLGAAAREAASRTAGYALFQDVVVVAARLEQGRHAQVIAGLERFVDSAPRWLQVYRAVLAKARAEVGLLDAARRDLDALAADGFAGVARDWSFPLALRHVAETCAWLDAREHAAALLALVEPYAGRFLVGFSSSTIEGAADRALGQLLALQGRLDPAVERHESALALETSFGAPALAARTRYWLARALGERAGAGDAARARALAAEALSEARQFGMALLEQHAASLGAALG